MRRIVVRSLSLTALTFTLAALPAVTTAQSTAAAPRVLSVATLAPSGSLATQALESMNRELRRRTSGRITMRWYMGGVQGDESEVVRKIRSGRLDGGALTATGLQHMHRPVLAFQLPGMFPDAPSFLRAYTALAPTLEQAFLRDGFALVNLSPGNGPRMFSTREIRTPDGLRLARPWQWTDDPILPALYVEAGATGVPLALTEVLFGLQSRRIDTVYAPPLAAIALQWSGHVRYMSERSASGSLGALVLSRATWQSLSEADRATLRAVVTQAVTIFRPSVERADAASLRTLQSRGITVVTLNAQERQRWIDLFDRTRARLSRTLLDAQWMARVQAAGRGP